jgi:hypothetical protein
LAARARSEGCPHLTRGWKVGLGIAAAIVGLNVLLAALHSATGGAPGGPASSSYATGSDGDAAYASLLARAGHHVVRERRKPRAAGLRPTDTAIVLDPPFVEPADLAALSAFVAAGGRLIAGTADGSWLRAPLPHPVWSGKGVSRSTPFAPLAELSGVKVVESAGQGSWSDTRGALPAAGGAGGTTLAVAADGAGRLLLLADSSPLQNAYLTTADNARFAVALAGASSRRVVFLETYHGYGSGSGVAAIPFRWRAALLISIAAALVFMLARGRRFGPPEAEGRELAPPRALFVESLAATLARTRDRREALEPLRRELRQRIAVRAGLGSDVDDDVLRAAAARLGLAPGDFDAAFGNDDIALGRAFARTGGERRQA